MTWLIVAAALAAVAVLLTAPGVVWGQNPSQPEFGSETATRSVDEKTGTGENIGEPVSASDTDDDTLTYLISGTDEAFFEIVGTSGQITVKSGTVLDYESDTRLC